MRTRQEPKRMSFRALAKVLHRSPSHICRVMNGKRESATLSAQLQRVRKEAV